MSRPTTITSSDFVKLLLQDPSCLSRKNFIVTGNCFLNHDNLGDTLPMIQNVVFSESVEISGFSNEDSPIIIGECEFLDDLQIRNCLTKNISINTVKVRSFRILRSQSKGPVWLKSLKVTDLLDISGLSIVPVGEKKDPFLYMEKLEMGDLVLCDNRFINVPLVHTDDIVTAKQFELLNIPVVLSREKVKEMIEKEERDSTVSF